MKDDYDAIVAGAGLWGCTVARRLAEMGKRVLVLEKRKAVGGNCRCRTIDGIEVHLYGSHIFHTSNEAVWKFVNRFAKFNDYRHCVLARTKKIGVDVGAGVENRCRVDGDYLYHLPIGKTLLEEFFGVSMKERSLNEFLDEPLDSSLIPHPSFLNRRQAIFDAFVRGYTSKQWGVPPEKVDASVIARLKVRDNFSTDYFDDPYQGIPVEGYNALFHAMLDHPDIKVKCNAPFVLENEQKAGCPIYYSGPIDALFNFKFGTLPWRTLRFETEHLEKRDFQGTTVVNYPDADVPFTRIHEFRHYHPEGKGDFAKPKGTIVTREYSATWQSGDEPYYPIDNAESRALLAKYREEVEKFNSSTSNLQSSTELIVGGRLGGYKYYDMDKSIAAALELELSRSS